MHGDVVQCIEQQLRSHGKMRTETSHASEQLVAYVFPLNIHLLQYLKLEFFINDKFFATSFHTRKRYFAK
ncbi:hypothetical protein T02_11334 [Trichinella nativa]|uniref:Uncharacterized protein n=1 Tax=Trichinella nativa TaxID=6335 RepID=A0A0V1LM63_9BILA|nr:hypothetical protein T06_1260 [Trichinella sp. T6]KRZ60580.1 hypothetical protein T02_11334 [Trichinella nativa]